MPYSPTPSSPRAQCIPLNLGIIAIQGEDAVKFLQGQVTCDVRELLVPQNEHQQILLGGQCNVKGRLLLIFHALQPKPDLILLFVNPELVEVGLANLRKYAVFFKVKLTSLTQEWRGFAITGANSLATIDKVFGSSHPLKAPLPEKSWCQLGEHLLVNFSASTDLNITYMIWLSISAQDFTQCETNLIANTQPASQSWQVYLIACGLPDLYLNTQELFTPQDLNLPLLNGVNFRKGCYTGQEIVARLHYKAKLKRHMVRFEMSDTPELPTPGTSLRDSQGKNLGEVVVTAWRDASTIELLASINDQGISDAFIEGNSQKLRQLPLPYAIPSENEVSSGD